jgi:hypothetical protein
MITFCIGLRLSPSKSTLDAFKIKSSLRDAIDFQIWSQRCNGLDRSQRRQPIGALPGTHGTDPGDTATGRSCSIEPCGARLVTARHDLVVVIAEFDEATRAES